jgi:hypothetical protein
LQGTEELRGAPESDAEEEGGCYDEVKSSGDSASEADQGVENVGEGEEQASHREPALGISASQAEQGVESSQQGDSAEEGGESAEEGGGRAENEGEEVDDTTPPKRMKLGRNRASEGTKAKGVCPPPPSSFARATEL